MGELSEKIGARWFACLELGLPRYSLCFPTKKRGLRLSIQFNACIHGNLLNQEHAQNTPQDSSEYLQNTPLTGRKLLEHPKIQKLRKKRQNQKTLKYHQRINKYVLSVTEMQRLAQIDESTLLNDL